MPVNPKSGSETKKAPPSRPVAKWFAQWWSTCGEPPAVPVRLLLTVTDAVFNDLEKRECDPCMLKARSNGHVIYLRRVPPQRYNVSVDHNRLGKGLKLEQALLLIRNHLRVEEPPEDGPDDGL